MIVKKNKIIYRYFVTTKLKKNLGHINNLRIGLREVGFTENEINRAIIDGMKEKQSKIFKLKRTLVKINKK